MPHCVIEVTNNLIPSIDPQKIMDDVVAALDKTGFFRADDIKVRIRPIEFFRMGFDNRENSYVAADVQLLNDKDDSQLSVITSLVHDAILPHFSGTVGKSSITTRVTLMDPNLYKQTVNY
jgi:5-carboxymethyl-2-hydroxymuconate isomerase